MEPSLKIAKRNAACYCCTHECNSNLENGHYSIPVCYSCVEEHLGYSVDIKDGTMTKLESVNPLRE